MTPEKIQKLNAERLEKVADDLRQKCERVIALAKDRGYSLLVTQGFRSIAEQNRLYAQGRTRPGKIVTNARGGQSKHNLGRAVDFAFVVKGEISWDVKLYKLLGAWAAVAGLKWGGNWKSFKDYPHVEI
jgi:peptidoglycan L-alanyl-D-glutamate endopeptidase CwlK